MKALLFAFLFLAFLASPIGSAAFYACGVLLLLALLAIFGVVFYRSEEIRKFYNS